MPANNLQNSYTGNDWSCRTGFVGVAVTGLLASALVILWLGNYTDLDLWLADWFFDPHQQTFPMRHNWFAAVFVHQWIKYFIMVPGLLVMALALADFVRPFSMRVWTRIRVRCVALSAFLIPLVICGIKRFSAMECPWELQRYGGHSPYLRLLDAIPAGWQAGHCFPAGYASTGLWLASFAVFWLPAAPRKAARVCLTGMIVGILLGLVQQARGAHFLSHTLWSVWIAAAVLLAIYAWYARRLEGYPN